MNRGASFTGREKEIEFLRDKLKDAVNSKGSTVIISGEPGMGKTRLIEEFVEAIGSGNPIMLRGESLPRTVSPFLPFSKALEKHIEGALFKEQEYISFTQIFAIDRTGMLVAKATQKGEEIDPDIFAGMLSAVQDFISDSFSNSKARGLGRLDYGDMKILIEHGEHLFLTAIFRGKEHPDMKGELKRVLERIEEKYGDVLESWEGKMEDVEPIEKEILSLAERRFLVRKELEGVKLETERIKIADKILDLLMELSEKRPVILILEDIHWADESSLFVLQYLARNIKKARVLILGTLRPRYSENAEKYIEKMRGEETVSEIKLESIGNESIIKLIEEMYPENSFPDEFIHKIIEHSEGNPLFLIEFLKNMEEDGYIEKSDDGYVLTSKKYSLPSTLEEIVEKRLENLDIPAMTVAEYASCIGRNFGKDALLSARVGSEAEMERLSSLGIIVIQGNEGEFVHAIFQEVIYSNISPAWKERYHRSIGEYYEREYREKENEAIYELARHFSHTREYAKAFDYSMKAGEKAESTYAATEAIDFYMQSLNLLDSIRDTERAGKKGEILERLGDIRMLTGEYDAAIEYYTKSLEIADNNGKKAVLYNRIANALEKKGDFETAMNNCEKGLSLIGKKASAERAGLLIKSAWLRYRNGEYDEAVKLTEKALAMAEKTNWPEYIALGNHVMGSIFLNKGDYEEAVKRFYIALDIRSALNDEWGMALTLNNIGNVLRITGDMEKALETYERSLELMKKVGSVYGEAALHNNMGLIFHFKGELDGALSEYDKILSITQRIGDRYGTALSLSNIGNALEDKGELEKALKIFEEGLEIQREIGDKDGEATSLSNIGNVMCEMGKYEESIRYNSESVKMMRGIRDPRGTAQALKNLAISYMEAGRYPEALESAEEALEISCEIGVKSIEGGACWVKGAVYRETGKQEESSCWFKKAMKILETGVDRSALAKGLYEYAQLFIKMEKKEKAENELKRALSMFEDMGMRIWTEKCRGVLAELEVGR